MEEVIGGRSLPKIDVGSVVGCEVGELVGELRLDELGSDVAEVWE